MSVFLVTNLKTRTKEWHVVKDLEALLASLEKKYGQESVKFEIKKITDDVSHFLKNQKSYDRTFGVGGKKWKNLI